MWQGWKRRLQALRALGLRRLCDLYKVKVFQRWSCSVEGPVPRHRRLWRVVPVHPYAGSIELRCCWHCYRSLDQLKQLPSGEVGWRWHSWD